MQMILVPMCHVHRPSSKLVALDLLRCLVPHLSDKTCLQRIIPFNIALLNDQDPLVRALTLRVMTSTLVSIQAFPPSDTKIFLQ